MSQYSLQSYELKQILDTFTLYMGTLCRQLVSQFCPFYIKTFVNLVYYADALNVVFVYVAIFFAELCALEIRHIFDTYIIVIVSETRFSVFCVST